MTNIETILSDCKSGLPDQSIDLILFIGVLPHLQDAKLVLVEPHRVLKPVVCLPRGTASVSAEKRCCGASTRWGCSG